MPGMSASEAAAARESYRSAGGRFGHQPRQDPGQLDSEPCGSVASASIGSPVTVHTGGRDVMGRVVDHAPVAGARLVNLDGTFVEVSYDEICGRNVVTADQASLRTCQAVVAEVTAGQDLVRVGRQVHLSECSLVRGGEQTVASRRLGRQAVQTVVATVQLAGDLDGPAGPCTCFFRPAARASR